MNLLTQDVATCCRCDKKYTIDQIPDSGLCPWCDEIEKDRNKIFGEGYNHQKVLAAIGEPDEPDTETPPMMTPRIAELVGFSPIDALERFYDFEPINT